MALDLNNASALLVEDEPLIALDAEMNLKACGFSEVVVAMTLTAAREAIGAKPRFAFALLDINLGQGETSYDLASELIESGVKVAFASGYNSAEGLVEKYGAPVISKPYAPTAIRDLVSALLVN